MVEVKIGFGKLSDIVALVEAREATETPKVRGPYKKRVRIAD